MVLIVRTSHMLWQASLLDRPQQADFLYGCPKQPAQGKERESDLADESGSSSPVVELFDPRQPIGPRVGKKAGDGWVLALLQRPDCEVAHAFATAHQQPLWIRQEAAEEEAEIQMFFKHRDVQNPVKAGIRGTIA